MARERRRAEFAAGARVQRIGEDGDLRTVGEEAVAVEQVPVALGVMVPILV